MNLKNTALITHKHCMDGSACAILFIVAGGNKDSIFYTTPSAPKVEETLEHVADHYKKIIVADNSISLEYAKNFRRDVDIQLLDHHESAIPLAALDWCEIDKENENCGSKMFYDFLRRNDLGGPDGRLLQYKSLVDTVDDHDRWVKKLPESDLLSTLHVVLGQEIFVDRFVKNPKIERTAQEEYVIALEEKKRDIYIGQKKQSAIVMIKEVDGKTYRLAYVIAEAAQHNSLLGHSICSDPALDVDAAVLIGPTGVSMRAEKDNEINLSKIASLNGGGGHRAAAGCPLEFILGMTLAEFVAEKMKIND